MRKRILNRYKKFVRKYGKITECRKRDPEPFYPKGSYFIVFQSFSDQLNACVGDVDEYHCYKELVQDIKNLMLNK